MEFGPEKKSVFPINRVERKNELDAAEKQADVTRSEEPNWGAPNSPLKYSPDWPHGVSFEGTFRTVLPYEETDLKGFIEETLHDKKGDAVGVEFGGPGSELFSGFSEGFFKKTFGIALKDSRDLMRPDPRPRDLERGHQVIEGNIFSAEVYEKLTKCLAGDKADLIFERMFGGLETVPREPNIVGQVLQRWYSLLNEGGMLFIQAPEEFARFAKAWERDVISKIPTIRMKRSEKIDTRARAFAMYIQKLHGAPAELPLLDLKTVAKISRRQKSPTEL